MLMPSLPLDIFGVYLQLAEFHFFYNAFILDRTRTLTLVKQQSSSITKLSYRRWTTPCLVASLLPILSLRDTPRWSSLHADWLLKDILIQPIYRLPRTLSYHVQGRSAAELDFCWLNRSSDTWLNDSHIKVWIKWLIAYQKLWVRKECYGRSDGQYWGYVSSDDCS